MQQTDHRPILSQKHEQAYNTHIPRLKINSRNNQITTSYIYHINTQKVYQHAHQQQQQHEGQVGEKKVQGSNYGQGQMCSENGKQGGQEPRKVQDKGKEVGKAMDKDREREGGVGGSMEEGRNIGFKGKMQIDRQDKQITSTKKKGIKQYTILITRQQQPEQQPGLLPSLSCFPPTILNTTSLKPNKLLSYFQVKIQSCSTSPSFSIGLVSAITQQLPPTVASSKSVVSLYFNISEEKVLQVYVNGGKVEERRFVVEVGDWVGVGYVGHTAEVFLTRNGQIVEKSRLYSGDLAEQKPQKQRKYQQFIQLHNHKFHPFLLLHSKQLTLQTIFQNSPTNFKFDYPQHKTYLSNKVIQHEMPKQVNISEQFTYSLVLNYFKFNGYEKTGQLFQEQMLGRAMKYYPQNQPMENMVFPREAHVQDKGKEKEKRIRKRVKKGAAVRRQNEATGNQPQGQIPVEEEAQHSNQQQHNQTSNIEQPQIQMQQFIQLKGSSILSKTVKTIEGGQESQKQRQRKQQQQQQVHYVLNKKKMDKKVSDNKRKQIEKIKISRIEIVKNIESANIEQALKIFSKSFKELYNRQKQLEMFFKAHTFLKIYYKDGLQSALEYAKKQHKNFTTYQSNLMPFFSHQNPGYTLRPLRQILFVICPQNIQKFNFKKQLSIFAQFISRIICEDAGYFGMSKLELVLGHYRVVRNIVEECGVGVAGLELQMDEEI